MCRTFSNICIKPEVSIKFSTCLHVIVLHFFLLQLVELKNGETYNGHLVSCDNWMNINLREVICTSRVSSTYVSSFLSIVVYQDIKEIYFIYIIHHM